MKNQLESGAERKNAFDFRWKDCQFDITFYKVNFIFDMEFWGFLVLFVLVSHKFSGLIEKY